MCPTEQFVRDVSVVSELVHDESAVHSVVFQVAGDDQRLVGAGKLGRLGRGLGKLLILTWSYSVKILSKQWESTAKLCLLFFGSPSRPA